MKCPRFVLSAAVLMLFAAVAFPQADMKDMQKPAASSEAQKSFDTLKTLAGSWEGRVKTVPAQSDTKDQPMQVTLWVTSMGNALVHEATGAGRPDDPITMLVSGRGPLNADPLL